MFVETILQEKGSRVVTIESDASVADLVSTLAEHNIGAVVVLGPLGRVAGIISERDIVRQLARSPEGLLERSVASLMTRSPSTCRCDDTLDEVMSRMSRGRFRHLPVIENGRLVGIVSIGDVVKRKIELVEQEAGALREYIAS